MNIISTILKGLWVGATMTVPGVSGGTMALVVGIYEKLIHAINGIRKRPKENILFLLQFLLGAGVGFLVFARCITYLLSSEQTGEVTRFIFMGIVAGGIPLLVKETGMQKVKFKHILFLLLGIGVVLGLMLLPKDLSSSGEGIGYYLMQILAGFIVAVAMILPGISMTHMLYILGMYETVLEDVYTLQLLNLLPLVIGLLLGTFLTANLLEYLMEKHRECVYMIIIGFVAGSLTSLIPESGPKHLLIDFFAVMVGFIAMTMLAKKVKSKEKAAE